MDLNPITAIAGEVMKGLDGLFTSDEERAKAELELTKQLQQPHILQAMTNLQEAKHRSVFVAGWRPSIGWIASLGLAYHFLVLPFASLLSVYLNLPAPLPSIDSGELMTLVLSLLGLGGLRTYEKSKGLTQ
jgi:hypothetical protein